MAHHDFEVLPNGHLLISAWLRHTFEEAVAAGRDPEKLEDDELWSDHLVEVRSCAAASSVLLAAAPLLPPLFRLLLLLLLGFVCRSTGR